MNGRPLALQWEHDNADAMLETWFAGTEGGNAIADVLFGDYNPLGKLPMTFPRSVGQVPIFYNHLNTGGPSIRKSRAHIPHAISIRSTTRFILLVLA